MAVYPFPSTLTPSRCRLTLSAQSVSFTSPYTGAEQTVALGGDTLVMHMEFVALDASRKRVLEGFIARLDGKQHRFTAPDFSHRQGGSLAGTPHVRGAEQRGKRLQTDGWRANQLVLRQGDQISIANYLYLVTADVMSAANGLATIPVYPGTPRTAPADDAPIQTTAPGGTWMLTDVGVTVASDPAFANASLLATQDVLV